MVNPILVGLADLVGTFFKPRMDANGRELDRYRGSPAPSRGRNGRRFSKRVRRVRSLKFPVLFASMDVHSRLNYTVLSPRRLRSGPSNQQGAANKAHTSSQKP